METLVIFFGLALLLALPFIIGMLTSILIQRTYLHRIIVTFLVLSVLYTSIRIFMNDTLQYVGFVQAFFVSGLTAIYSGKKDVSSNKRKLSKLIAETLRPTIKAAIKEDEEASKRTLISDRYYGYIVGFVTQVLREEGYKYGEFDFQIIFRVMKNLSNRHIAEAHRVAVEAFLNEKYQDIGRDIKGFEDGFKIGEYDAKSKSLENLRRIIINQKLYYRV